jgi:hypothetical protein
MEVVDRPMPYICFQNSSKMLCLTDVPGFRGGCQPVLKILEIMVIPFSPPTLTSGIGITKRLYVILWGL